LNDQSAFLRNNYELIGTTRLLCFHSLYSMIWYCIWNAVDTIRQARLRCWNADMTSCPTRVTAKRRRHDTSACDGMTLHNVVETIVYNELRLISLKRSCVINNERQIDSKLYMYMFQSDSTYVIYT